MRKRYDVYYERNGCIDLRHFRDLNELNEWLGYMKKLHDKFGDDYIITKIKEIETN